MAQVENDAGDDGSDSEDLPERPLPPPPTMGELAEVFGQRLRLRYPSLDPVRVLLVVAALVALGGMAWAVWSPRGSSDTSAPVRVVVSSTSSSSTVAPSTTRPDLVVDVAGAVRRPGPVRLTGEARVDAAIAAAGGPRSDADLERVDRAAPLSDGQRVYVPRKGQEDIPEVVEVTGGGEATSGSPTSAGGDEAGGPVNVNTANADELATLPGVGPATAQAILDHRSSHGRFSAVDDLLDVRGIGPAKMAGLRPLVTV